MENQKQNTEQPIKFLQISAELLSCTHVQAPDGTIINLGGFERMLYSYMLFRYTGFKSANKSFFEEQETFRKFFPFVSIKTIQRAIKTLEQCGMITVQRKSGSKGKGNIYIVNDFIPVNCDTYNEKMKRDTSFSKQHQPRRKQTTIINNSYVNDCDLDQDEIPF
ncbi:hypothetical protein [Aeromonas phage 4L372XY]|uniref:Replication protein n=1 Tax=Aeromonas phage 4L372XY TaxID=2588520 RepID=A0A5B9N3L7_9CAUD|nr:hypothetical protein HWC28_gp032 [Aeromonas phage 4L372XY]QEG08747.1 hypothetical protein [Aeromonas phage 4L372XY]